MKGRRGLIMGVANDKSIAWGIAKACAGQGAELAFSYQGEQLKKAGRTRWPGGRLANMICPATWPTRPASTRFSPALPTFGAASISSSTPSAFPTRTNCAAATSIRARPNFQMTMDISVYSFTAVCQRAEKLMPPGGSLLTLTYYGAEKVMPHYNVMGVAKAALEASVKYLAEDLGQGRHPRQRDLGRDRSRRWRPAASAISATS
jgi:enoyl-[acyl-carrier protein] reductase I